jgi:hypothetical protein
MNHLRSSRFAFVMALALLLAKGASNALAATSAASAPESDTYTSQEIVDKGHKVFGRKWLYRG